MIFFAVVESDSLISVRSDLMSAREAFMALCMSPCSLLRMLLRVFFIDAPLDSTFAAIAHRIYHR